MDCCSVVILRKEGRGKYSYARKEKNKIKERKKRDEQCDVFVRRVMAVDIYSGSDGR